MAQDAVLAPIFRTAVWWLADDKFTGIDWSFADAVNLDIRDCVREVKISQKPTLITWLTAQCTAMIYTSNNKLVVFCDDWKIFLESSGSLTQVTTATPSTKIYSACEFNGYLYWTTYGKLHRIEIANINTTFTGNETINRQALENSNYYPMLASVWDMWWDMYVWHAGKIGKVDTSNVWNNAVTMDSGWEIKYLLDLWGSIRIITTPRSWKSTLYLRDWAKDSPDQTIPLNWIDVLQTIIYNWYHYIITSDGMWIMDGYRIHWLNERHDFSNVVWAIAIMNKYMIIGSKDSYLYVYGAKTKNYTEVLNKEYVITAPSWTTWTFTIDTIVTVGKKIYFTWHTASAYWLNLLDTEQNIETNCGAMGYLITRAYYANTMYDVKETLRACIWFQALRDNENIKIYYSIDGWEFTKIGDYTDATTLLDNFTDDIEINSSDFQYIQFKIELYRWSKTVNNTTTYTSPRFNMLDLVFNNNIRR